MRVRAAAFSIATVVTLPASAQAVTFVAAGAVGSGIGHFYYHGHWEHVRDRRDGRYLGASARTAVAGAVVILYFSGTVVRIYGVRGPGGGHGIVTVDGRRYADVDFYSPRKQPQAVVFESPVLPSGIHTLAIAAVGEPRVFSRSGSYVNLTAAAYR